MAGEGAMEPEPGMRCGLAGREQASARMRSRFCCRALWFQIQSLRSPCRLFSSIGCAGREREKTATRGCYSIKKSAVLQSPALKSGPWVVFSGNSAGN
jgi:hypothetical protein